MIKQLTISDITEEFLIDFNKIFDDVLSLENVRSFVSDPNYFFFVDYQDGEFAGYIYGYFIRGTRRSKWFGHIWSLKVAKKYRRKGIGQNLVNSVIELGKKRECRGIFLITQDDEGHALEFYKKIGGEQINDGLDRVVWFRLKE